MTKITLLAFVIPFFLCCTKETDNDTTDGRTAPLLEGMGSHHHSISTDVDLAQRFFDQGLILSYGFNHKEAERSFREAARLDSNCAMAYWGVALVLGPNINGSMDPEDAPKAYEALEKAIHLAPDVTEKEQGYIQALSTRYQPQALDDRSELDKAYANAMRELHQRYPDDMDAAALTAEALMDLHPWDYWEKSGKAKPWTPEILKVLEYAMERNPHHPGANHFYIHAVEASKSPDRGLPSAERLGDVVPGAGHLVHMPSHIYIRVGKYHEGSLANERAIKSDDSYVTQCRAQGIYPLAYVPHNHHFLWATATLEGASEKAIAAAKSTSAKVDTAMMRQPGLGTLQHFLVIPLYAYVRFGKWAEILAYSKPADDLVYPQGVWHYARGIAFARTGRFEEAEQELNLVRKISVNPALNDITIWDINRTDQLMEIAANALAGELAAAQRNYEKAIKHLQAAVTIEDRLTYNEPPDWFFPVRHSLGAVLIEAGRPADAELVYRADLETFPENGWSLFGLKKSLELQNKKTEVEQVEARLEKAWAWSDIQLAASRL
ncbi:MAG: hypothetical protein O7D34_04275 [Ignavibacteria bacterium]|nr:hypothetical protein [Ignavibacteria bacterium]